MHYALIVAPHIQKLDGIALFNAFTTRIMRVSGCEGVWFLHISMYFFVHSLCSFTVSGRWQCKVAYDT